MHAITTLPASTRLPRSFGWGTSFTGLFFALDALLFAGPLCLYYLEAVVGW